MIWQFTITDSASVSTIVDEPNGFTEMSYTIRRNIRHHGVFKSIDTGSLKWVGDAYGILLNEYETNGADATSTLLIEYKCAENDDFATFFNGKFDYNTFSRFCGKYCYIECQVIATSCVDLFMNGIDTNIDFDTTTSLNGDTITALGSDTLTIAGQTIVLRDSANNNEVSSISDTKQTVATGLHNVYQAVYLPHTTDESLGTFNANGLSTTMIIDADGILLDPNGTALGAKWTDFMQFTSILEPPTTGLVCLSDYDYIFEGTGTMTFTAQYNGDVEVAIILKKYSSDTDEFTFIQSEIITASSSFTANIPTIIPIDYFMSGSIALQSTDVLCYYLKYRINQTTGAGIPLDFTVQLETPSSSVGLNRADIQQDSTCAATTTKSYNLQNVFEWFPSAVNNCFDVTCNANCFTAYELTNGLMIRNVTSPVTPKLFLSWTDLVQNISKIFNIGWGFANNDTELIVDDLDYFYSDTAVIDLGSVNEANFEHAKDLTYGLINVGYSKWEAEEYSGLDEMNTQRQYKRNVTTNNTQLDLLSNFITAGYTIEITRRKNMPLTGTSDWRYDNDIFLIDSVEVDGTLYARNGGITTPTNIISPDTRINYRLTPIRTLLNWFRSIVAPTPTYTDAELIFNSGTGNYIASGGYYYDCYLENAPIAENGTITHSNFTSEADATPLWKAIYATFTCPLSIADKETLDANPYGTITFSCNGVEYSGFLMECTYTPEQGTANFKILLKHE